MDHLFGSWTDTDRDVWKALDENLAEREVKSMAENIAEHGETVYGLYKAMHCTRQPVAK